MTEKARRSYIGHVTLSGSEERGYSIAVPKTAVRNLGAEQGDTIALLYDPVEDEVVFTEIEAPA